MVEIVNIYYHKGWFAGDFCVSANVPTWKTPCLLKLMKLLQTKKILKVFTYLYTTLVTVIEVWSRINAGPAERFEIHQGHR